MELLRHALYPWMATMEILAVESVLKMPMLRLELFMIILKSWWLRMETWRFALEQWGFLTFSVFVWAVMEVDVGCLGCAPCHNHLWIRLENRISRNNPWKSYPHPAKFKILGNKSVLKQFCGSALVSVWILIPVQLRSGSRETNQRGSGSWSGLKVTKCQFLMKYIRYLT